MSKIYEIGWYNIRRYLLTGIVVEKKREYERDARPSGQQGSCRSEWPQASQGPRPPLPSPHLGPFPPHPHHNRPPFLVLLNHLEPGLGSRRRSFCRFFCTCRGDFTDAEGNQVYQVADTARLGSTGGVVR